MEGVFLLPGLEKCCTKAYCLVMQGVWKPFNCKSPVFCKGTAEGMGDDVCGNNVEIGSCFVHFFIVD